MSGVRKTQTTKPISIRRKIHCVRPPRAGILGIGPFRFWGILFCSICLSRFLRDKVLGAAEILTQYQLLAWLALKFPPRSAGLYFFPLFEFYLDTQPLKTLGGGYGWGAQNCFKSSPTI